MGQYTEAVGDAAKATRVAEPTARRLYNAARVYAKAAVAAAGDVRRKRQDSVAVVNQYQDQAVALVRRALERQQSSQREVFLRDLRDVVQSDPAMKPLRRRLRSLLGG